jgi:hypothetical protein
MAVAYCPHSDETWQHSIHPKGTVLPIIYYTGEWQFLIPWCKFSGFIFEETKNLSIRFTYIYQFYFVLIFQYLHHKQKPKIRSSLFLIKHFPCPEPAFAKPNYHLIRQISKEVILMTF